MECLLRLRLESNNHARARHRWYEVRLGRDLFGLWMVTIEYGRDGIRGQSLVYSAPDPKGARDIIGYFLDRRVSSHFRIGNRYRVAEVTVTEGFRPGDWICDAYLPAGFPIPSAVAQPRRERRWFGRRR